MAEGYKIRFIDVGRDRKCWETEVPGGDLALPAILRSVVKSKALRSRSIEVVANGTSGLVLAGGRSVGRFEIE